MTNVLLPAVLLVSILTLAVAIRTLLSSRRSEVLHENRYELLRDQHDRLEFLREERQTLIEELERQSRERQLLMEFLGKTPPQLVEDLKKVRGERADAQERIEDLKQELHQLNEQLAQEHREHLGSQQRAERLEREQMEQSGIQQEVGRSEQERQRLVEALEREREERLGAEQRAEQQEQERARLQRELRSLKAEPDSHRRASTSDRALESGARATWQRRPVLVIGVLFGVLVAWLTSLMVALTLVSP